MKSTGPTIEAPPGLHKPSDDQPTGGVVLGGWVTRDHGKARGATRDLAKGITRDRLHEILARGAIRITRECGRGRSALARDLWCLMQKITREAVGLLNEKSRKEVTRDERVHDNDDARVIETPDRWPRWTSSDPIVGY